MCVSMFAAARLDELENNFEKVSDDEGFPAKSSNPEKASEQILKQPRFRMRKKFRQKVANVAKLMEQILKQRAINSK
ncbi:unnamed protein product [Dovyalis caffra]|uniref:Uncharacterized protein n=1 Tax=Dovyalis caffra TaxID=77055 RepID=A0AAV1S493_9ROSI|nr:unnamed protein product [Dovyalis caffra]